MHVGHGKTNNAGSMAVEFLEAAYTVFITRFRRMASGHGYIYIYI